MQLGISKPINPKSKQTKSEKLNDNLHNFFNKATTFIQNAISHPETVAF